VEAEEQAREDSDVEVEAEAWAGLDVRVKA
jgi:hypothetical protein